MEKHTFKTAEFAALCGVKKDTLLHYDHIDLLKPQRVGENGYRYYSARQLPTYDLIAALQRLGTPLAEIRDYLNRRSPEALLSLLEEKEAALDAERRRLEQMGRLLEDTVDKVRQAQSVRPGDFFLEEQPETLCAVVPAPKIHNETFDEAVYLLHVRQLLAWARANGIPSQAPGDIICRETLERGEVTEDFYYCPVPPGTTGWPTRVRPAGTYAVLCHQGSYQSEYDASRALVRWVGAQGYRIAGDLYEEDLVNYSTSSDPEYYLMKISLNIRK